MTASPLVSMKTLLLIPSVLKQGVEPAVAADGHPRMDYYALAAALDAAGGRADLLDFAAVDAARHPLVRLVRRVVGRSPALALLGFLERHRYDAVFSNGENVAIPLALLLKLARRRPGHVTIGHRLSAGKKAPFFRLLRVQRQIDTLFVYARTQHEHARGRLGIPTRQLRLIPFHTDHRFFRPLAAAPEEGLLVCSAGLEWRDYPTLLAAARALPEATFQLAAASPWSRHQNETADRVLPPNVSARRYDYGELRALYARSAVVVVPLYETDFQAGVTTLLEAMGMGKAVIVTRTTGQTDVVVEGETGLTVAPGDVEGWRRSIRLLLADPALQERLGGNARRWVEQHATLDRWTGEMVAALQGSAVGNGMAHPAAPRAPSRRADGGRPVVTARFQPASVRQGEGECESR